MICVLNSQLSVYVVQVGNRIIRKRIHVRVEHVQPSRCAEEFKLRKIKNDELKREAKARGEKISTKRQPQGPKPGFMVEGATLETVTPIPYDVVNDLKGGYWVRAHLFALLSPPSLFEQFFSLLEEIEAWFLGFCLLFYLVEPRSKNEIFCHFY